MTEAIPVCPECGGPMHLTGSSYGRSWECDRGDGVDSWCSGVIAIADDEILTVLQIAELIARRSWGGSQDSAKQQTKYRRLSNALQELTKSPFLSGSEKGTLGDARAIVERLAEAAELAKDRVKRNERIKEDEREARYRKAYGLLGTSFAPDPTRLEASVVDLLALDRYSDDGWFSGYESVETFETALRRKSGGDQNPLDVLIRDLVSGHQALRDTIARDWSRRDESLDDLHTQFLEAVRRLREEILRSTPVFLQGVRRLLTETESANVVRLAPRDPN